jgi:hypothetical protein
VGDLSKQRDTIAAQLQRLQETLASLGPLAGPATSAPASDATQTLPGPVRSDGA